MHQVGAEKTLQPAANFSALAIPRQPARGSTMVSPVRAIAPRQWGPKSTRRPEKHAENEKVSQPALRQ